MRKKLLFVAPDYYGFHQVVMQGLMDYSGYDVIFLKSNLKFHYKSFGQNFYNTLSKVIFHKNRKPQMRDACLKDIVDQQEHYDLLFINAPYLLSDTLLNYILQKSQTSVCIFWDSIDKIPPQKNYLNRFNKLFSFDPVDCKHYHLLQITNFFFAEAQQQPSSFDVAYLATYDTRITDTKRIIDRLEEQNITVKAKIFIHKASKSLLKLPPQVELTYKIVPFPKAYRYYLDSKVILDIAHSNQKGLSFRPFDAMGLRKKLITTNTDIVHYDFYHPNNIFVIDNINDFTIPSNFFTTPYQDIPSDIKKKYTIKNWIKQITTI